jgi:hypothetical protein
MKTLYKLFTDILKEKEKWQYYKNMNIEDNLDKIFNNPTKFICDYLQNSGKLTNELENNIGKLSDNRCKHTISIFFLGLLFYHYISELELHIYHSINSAKVDINKSNIDLQFNYWWFLICLIHDIGYSYNDNQGSVELFGKKKHKEILFEIEENLNSILRDSSASVPEKIINNWKKYLDYKPRKNIKDKKKEKIDHGILAGAYYIYSISKLYEKKKSGKTLDENFGFYDNNQLYWSQTMLDYFHKPIAWIITAHNIWYKNRNCENTEDYEKELKNLIIDKPIVCLKKYPLYFLLSLVDTLDPVKYIQQLESNVVTILKNTQLCLSHNTIEIKFVDELIKYNKGYNRKTSDIGCWMDIETDLNLKNLLEKKNES